MNECAICRKQTLNDVFCDYHDRKEEEFLDDVKQGKRIVKECGICHGLHGPLTAATSTKCYL